MADEYIANYKLQQDAGFEVHATKEGSIDIVQQSTFGDDDSLISVSVERVDYLIRFLQAARDEIMTARADAAAQEHARQ